jgi:hypothetical protein
MSRTKASERDHSDEIGWSAVLMALGAFSLVVMALIFG